MALATWTWFGNIRGVFLTVAGVDGAVLSGDDPVVTGLAAAIRLGGDPHVPLQIASYQPVLFTFTAAVAVDQADYAPTQVLAQVWQDLAAAFAFGQRQFGQGVAASEIIEIIQQVAGVTAVQLQALGRSGAAPQGPGPAMLCVQRPAAAAMAPQLLQLDPATQGRSGSGRHEPRRQGSCTRSFLPSTAPATPQAADQLQALFAVMAAQSAIVEDNINQLYDDQFIETCAPWVIPYIGDLIGYNSIYEIAAAGPGRRAEVANTIGYRRRKGTLLALEQVTRGRLRARHPRGRASSGG